jgi:hypothetical protein
LVSFLVIASVLFLATTVSAASSYGPITVKIDGDVVSTGSLPSVVAGDTITMKISFQYLGTDADKIRVKATIEGTNNDVTVSSSSFDVEHNQTYTQSLTLKVPSDFETDQLVGNFPLTVKIGEELFTLGNLHVQRPSADVAIKSVSTSNPVSAGQLVPVEVVLKNVGYNDLKDMYVTASIDDLKVSKTGYFGDLVTLATDTSNDENAVNTVKGTLYLQVPYNVKAGTYTLTVTAENDDTTSTKTTNVVVNNAVPDIAMKSGSNSLTLLNPTNQLVVYTVKYDTTTANVVVPAASSKDVAISLPSTGDYNFDVSVLSGDQILSSVNFSGTGQTAPQVTSPVLVLTVILAVVFLVLLVVLIVLITKKPQKTEEFGESYY